MATELREKEQRRTSTPGRRRMPMRRIAVWGPFIAVLVIALMLIAGIWRHIQLNHARQDYTQRTSKVTVQVIPAKRDGKPHNLLLPGNIEAMYETTIYARANGYVARWLVDIGDNVKEGQLLAELETPELDQQLAAARDTLKQNEANFENARTTAERYQSLVQKQAVSKQENDDRQANLQVTSAGVSAGKANVARLEQLQGFKKIVAPFSGKITSRRIDIGSLVSEGSGNAGTVMFTLAQTDPVRVFVDVPQSEAPLIKVGDDAKIIVQELRDRDFTGKIARTSGSLDPVARTLHTEVDAPNHDGTLLVGMYAQVKFTLFDKSAPLLIPSNAFVFRPEGTLVAIVTPENKIHWQKIVVGRDFGTSMEVLRDLNEGAQVVMNPSDDLTENLVVEAKPAPQQKEAEASKDGH